MKDSPFRYVRIISDAGESHVFDPVTDFQINFKAGMIMVRYPGGEFCLLLDRLRHADVGLPPQAVPDTLHSMTVTLVPLADQADGTPGSIDIPDVIKYDWKVDNGLFMVFCKTATQVFHLDHVLSFRQQPQ
jgi:hypothetical protein